MLARNLSSDVSACQLRNAFAAYGAVEKLYINVEDDCTWAVITYCDPGSAQDCLKGFVGDNHDLRGNSGGSIKVSLADADGNAIAVRRRSGEHGYDHSTGDDFKEDRGRSYKLFVGQLPREISEEAVKDVFQQYGGLQSVTITKVSAAGNSGAVIVYDNEQAAREAIDVLNGKYSFYEDENTPCIVEWFRDKVDTTVDGSVHGGERRGDDTACDWGYKLYVCDIPHWVTKSELTECFQKYGGEPVVHQIASHRDQRLKAAFVFYNDKGAANDAIKNLNGKHSFSGDRGPCIHVRWGRPSIQRDDESAGWKRRRYDDQACHDDQRLRTSEVRGEGYPLYVANLPRDIEEKEIGDMFGRHGRVLCIKIMRRTIVDDMVAAIVDMKTQEEAKSCVSRLNEKYSIRKGYPKLKVKFKLQR